MDIEFRTICFTGPRPDVLHGYNRELYYPIVDVLKSVVKEFAASGTKEFISGGAQGFDQLAFWAVNRIMADFPAIKNNVYVPFSGQPRIWREHGVFSQEEYRLMLSKATSVRILAKDPIDKNSAIHLMHRRNHFMVNDSDAVIALLAGRSLSWATSNGGTAECVRYAVNTGKPVLALRYENGEINKEWLSVVAK